MTKLNLSGDAKYTFSKVKISKKDLIKMSIFVNFQSKFHLPVGWCCKVKIASVSRTPPMIRLTPKQV